MRRRPLLILLVGMILIIGGVALGFVLTAGDDNGPDVSDTVSGQGTPRASRSTGGTDGGPETVSTGLASRFAPLLTELPGVNQVNVPDTFAMNLSSFAASYLFVNNSQGETLAKQWQILDAFQVAYQPRGLAADALQGRYFVTVETYLFNQVDGAKSAYAHMANLYKSNTGSVVEKAKGLGNESSGYSLTQGTIAASDMVAIYHRFLFRRGNVVTVVQTLGGTPFMTIDQARDIAVIIDDKILGKRQAIEPTPIPTPSFGGN
jgi:hypothetical protein